MTCQRLIEIDKRILQIKMALRRLTAQQRADLIAEAARLCEEKSRLVQSPAFDSTRAGQSDLQSNYNRMI